MAKDLAPQDIHDVDLSTVTTIDEAIALWETTHRATEVLGDGFVQVEDKNELVKEDFFIVKFKEVDGDFGSFMLVWIITKDGRKLRFSDGSTGVKEQLLLYREKTGQEGGLAVARGLTKSEYEPTDSNGHPLLNDKGEPMKATTYYLNES